MNRNFEAFVNEARAVAFPKHVNWEMRLDSSGAVISNDAWNLTGMTHGSPPPTHWLRHFGKDRGALSVLKSEHQLNLNGTCAQGPVSSHWQNLIKACVIDQLFVRGNSTGHARFNIARPLFVLATCAGAREPWELTSDDAALAFNTAKNIMRCGKLADLVFSVISDILDANHLIDRAPLAPTLLRDRWVRRRPARFTKSLHELRSDLDRRKHAEKLPERRAFWEMVRIVFTEQPRTFRDFLRFAQVKTLLLTGLRVGEVVRLPADWKRHQYHYDAKGQPAGNSGGYSRSLMVRHFAEKQRNTNNGSMALFETSQHVPEIFDEVLGGVYSIGTRRLVWAGRSGDTDRDLIRAK